MAQKISRRTLAKSIAAQLVAGTDQRKLALSLAAYLLDRKMTDQLDMLLGDIAHELSQHKHVFATVTSAHALSAALQADITAYLKNRSGATKVELDQIIDPSIIGGVVIQTSNEALDLSIRAKLNRLQQV